MEALHITRYLHSKGRLRRRLPDVRSIILELARAVDAVEGWQLLGLKGRGAGRSYTSQIFPEASSFRESIRCAEIHESVRGGCLPYWDHYDVGSLVWVTLDNQSSFFARERLFCKSRKNLLPPPPHA